MIGTLVSDRTTAFAEFRDKMYRKQKLLLFLKGCHPLPGDVTRKIYEEYLKPEMLYEDLIYTLDLRDSRTLSAGALTALLPRLLENKILVKYLLENDSTFNNIYTHHIINKKKIFVNADSFIISMAMSWLFYLYH